MKRQIIVSVGREHGSGGHYIAQLLAEKLHLRIYDKEIVEMMTQTGGYSREIIAEMDEKPINFFTSRKVKDYSNSLERIVAERTFDFIRSHAESGEPFVVVGRCSDYILRDNPYLLRVFIRGDKQDKIRRVMRQTHVSESEAGDIIKDIDRKRKAYHNYYCDIKWGDSRGYDVIFNSSKLGVEKTAEGLIHYVRVFMNQEDNETQA